MIATCWIEERRPRYFAGATSEISAAECVGQGARQRRADGATQQHGRDVEARPDILRIEGNPQAVNGSVDHARVESKKKSADRGDGGDEKDLAETALSCIHTYSR